MKTKAVRLYGKEDLRLEEFELPEMKEDEILKYYDQSILEFSFDGKLLNKTNYAKVLSPGRYSMLGKAWITDNKMNTLEQIVDTNNK